jgi:DNA-binding transcriptional ArsR family regulator
MRRKSFQIAEDLVSALESVLLGIGLTVERDREACEPNTPGLRPRVDTVLRVNGHVVAVEVKSVVTGANAAQILSLAEILANPLLVVADRIAEDAKTRFHEAGVNYFDARGHVRLVLPGVLVDTELSSALNSRSTKSSLPLDGEVAKEVALILLDKPDSIAGVRSIARAIQRAPSAVATALERLRDAGLATSANEPIIPELFWELATVWTRAPIALGSAPRPGEARTTDPLQLGVELDAPLGWALTDSAAARAWGMPLVLSSEYPPDFYVPSLTALQRAIATLGSVVRGNERGCTVSLAPTPLVCRRRVSLPNESWKVAEHVVVALDLWRDESRGREVLERWVPPDGIARVW